MGAAGVEAEASVAIEKAAEPLVALGEESQVVVHSAFLHAMEVAIVVIVVHGGNPASTGRVCGEPGGVLCEPPELCGIAVEVGAFVSQTLCLTAKR